MFKFCQVRIPAQFNDWTVSPSEITYPINVWNNHPSTKYVIPFHIYDTKSFRTSMDAISLFTDGSVCPNLVGAAFVLMKKKNGSIIKIGKYCMPRHATIFDAEVLALMMGIEHLLTADERRDCDVFTDSLSTLQALSNSMNTNPKFFKLKQNINLLSKKM